MMNYREGREKIRSVKANRPTASMWSHCWRAWDPILGTGCKTLMATKSNCFTQKMSHKSTGFKGFYFGGNIFKLKAFFW